MRGVRPALVAAAVVLLSGATVTGIERLNRLMVATFAHPAIDYEKSPPADLVAELNAGIERGSSHLTFDGPTGYLRSVLTRCTCPWNRRCS